jgi:hypothetical protein
LHRKLPYGFYKAFFSFLNMKKILCILFAILAWSPAFSQGKYITLFEESGGKETPEYEAVIDYFQLLARDFKAVKIVEKGMTDAGYPFRVVLFDQRGDFDPIKWHRANRPVLFVNNGIHPGEPDGIDASMMWLRDILLGKIKVPTDLAIAIIPVYNIGGHLNRGSFSRVNQNGPEAYGFRANARNYDLNRDFIKADTRNAQGFQEIFAWLNPHVFVDTHVSNGADYQHVMTLISTQHNRLGGMPGKYLREELDPMLYEKMKAKGFPMIPYVNAYGSKPEDGWNQFKDSGRYSSGFAALFGTLSFMPETHMLKPYEQRVKSTYAILEVFLDVLARDGQRIADMVNADRKAKINQMNFGLNHTVDRSQYREFEFLGYRSGQKTSEVSGLPRLYYDREQPFTATIKFYDGYQETLTIQKPKAYVIPQGWFPVIENLKRNGVRLERLEKDTLLTVAAYHIADFQTAQRPFEGHYLHSQIKVTKSTMSVPFRKGDYLIPMNQETNRYITEVLEPEGEDSFFAWNFFDTILQQKEGYSAYVFEDLAASYLRENPSLQKELEAERANNPEFAKNASAQLRWVYERSPWKEKEHNLYPVFRLEN